MHTDKIKGRFAPSPTGRMHLGNIAAALVSWLSVKSRGGKWVLRIEDLDPQRSRMEYARQIEDDLIWLGLEWDEGGIDGKGDNGPYMQSRRDDRYSDVLKQLKSTGLTYPCFCSRGEILSTQAPHQSDGRIVYQGTCRPPALGGMRQEEPTRRGATRLFVPDKEITFTDRHFGAQSVNLAHHCGDFILQRADGAWAYQLAVVVDDADMGITEVVRGSDLLLSSAQQIYLYNLLELTPPEFAHVPLVCNAEGRRLSKRDQSLSMEAMRSAGLTPQEIIGKAASLMGLLPKPEPVTAASLIDIFEWSKIPSGHTVTIR